MCYRGKSRENAKLFFTFLFFHLSKKIRVKGRFGRLVGPDGFQTERRRIQEVAKWLIYRNHKYQTGGTYFQRRGPAPSRPTNLDSPVFSGCPLYCGRFFLYCIPHENWTQYTVHPVCTLCSENLVNFYICKALYKNGQDLKDIQYTPRYLFPS